MTERTFRHTPDMGEISGFGRSNTPEGEQYEECCQAMLEAGVRWLCDHPEAHLRFGGYQKQDSPDAAALSEVVAAAARPHGGATGAMHNAVIARLLFIQREGWEAYCDALRAAQEAEPIKVGR